jgi:hypothetical protein
VIQEAVLAKEAILFCGNHSVKWDQIILALELFRLVLGYPNSTAAANTPMLQMAKDIVPSMLHLSHLHVGNSPADRQDFELMEVLYCTSPCDIRATDARDRLYGLLGLIKEEN